MRGLIVERGSLIILFGLMLFLGFNRHSKDTFNNYHSVLWSDASGYHVYLPLLFRDIDHLTEASVIENILANSGRGFQVKDSQISTKYPFGVALLQCPFYLFVKTVFPLATPYSKEYQYAMLVSGVFYAWCSMLLLFYYLKRNGYSLFLQWFVCIALFFGTSIYYYAIDSPGFSHAYSMFWMLLLVYVWGRTDLISSHKSKIIVILAITGILITRPLNGLWIVPVLYMFDSLRGNGWFQFIQKAKSLFSGKVILIWLVPTFLLSFQVYVWSIMTGSSTVYSYGNEGFDYLLEPRILQVLFSTNNGMILYTPMWLIILSSLVLNFKQSASKIALLLFGGFVYLYGSWWSWYLGCSFGYRGIVELLPLFSLVALEISNAKNWLKVKPILLALPIVFVLLNLKMIYSYDECWTAEDWDYRLFIDSLILGSTR